MKRGNSLSIPAAVFAAGFSSVTAQLVLIREFLAGFEGNEFVISLILLAWLLSSGMGSLLALLFSARTGRASARALGMAAVLMAALPGILILLVRYLRNILFVQGSSVGFYPTCAFVFGAIAPYALLMGFFFPFSLFVIRSQGACKAWAIYALDCLGAAAGGALFYLVLVHVFTVLGVLFLSGMVLAAASWLILINTGMNRFLVASAMAAFLLISASCLALEHSSLKPAAGELLAHKESFSGRIILTKDHELYTVYIDGVPALSGHNQAMAEEAAHYGLAQLKTVKRVLLVSSVAGIIEEVAKYRPSAIDYVQLDPLLFDMEEKIGLMTPRCGLRVIREDARAWLKQTDARYDAVLVNYPEPKTFQNNRYFTEEFMWLARSHLNPEGVLAFSVQGYDACLSQPGRLQVSSLYNTACKVFCHVLVLPGQRTFFIAGDVPLSPDIPGLLAAKGIRTDYIGSYFAGDVSLDRILGITKLLDPGVPLNQDLRPYLMRIAHEGWFSQYDSYPYWFFALLGAFFLIYLSGLRREEYVLFTTGCVNMGGEILVIFCFQILFGFIYLKLSLIITAFLAGLFPGALLGGRWKGIARRNLMIADCLITGLLMILAVFLVICPGGLNELFFYVFAFLVSVLCGLEFPLVADSGGPSDAASARAFSVDLVGAAFGNVLLSALVIPFLGIIGACMVLITIKFTSIIVQISHGRVHPETVPSL